VRQLAIPRRNDTPARPAFRYIFASALRAAGRSMEAAPSSWLWHSYTVNLLLTSTFGALFGTACSRPALPMCLLEGRHRRRLQSAMDGCFPSFVGQSCKRRRHVAFHANASLALPRMLRRVAQPGQHAHGGHHWPIERLICARSCGAVRVLCSCAHVQSRRPWVVWKVKIMNIFCSTPLSIPRRTDSDAMLGVASFASVRAQAWSKVNWVLH
jgi:hypothetical protein